MSTARDPSALDGRRAPELRAELAALVRACLPAWRLDPDSREPGAAVVNAFAHLAEILVSRVDRAPRRRGMACLSALGDSLVPAQPALVPVRFTAAPGTIEPVLVPASTQVSAQGEDGPIVFETREDLRVHSGGLIAAVGVDPFRDRIHQPPAGFLESAPPVGETIYRTLAEAAEGSTRITLEHAAGLEEGHHLLVGDDLRQLVRITEKPKEGAVRIHAPLTQKVMAGERVKRVTTFAPFDGINEQEHAWYIGDDELLKIEHPAAITVVGENVGPEADLALEWQAWTQADGEEPGWETLEEGQPEQGTLAVLHTGAKLVPLELDGKESRWLRCLLKSEREGDPPRQSSELPRFAEVRLKIDSAAGMAPDRVFCNTAELKLPEEKKEGRIQPFGDAPRVSDALYIASDETFSKKGATATLASDFRYRAPRRDAQATGFSPLTLTHVVPAIQLALEYWNGMGWVLLPLLSPTEKKGAGHALSFVRFNVPEDMRETEVAGQRGLWIRVRIAGGNALQISFVPRDDVNDRVEIRFIQVTLRVLELSYQSTASTPRWVLTRNALQWRDQTAAAASIQGFPPFEALEARGRALYLGFESAVVGAANLLAHAREWEERRTRFAWSSLTRGEWSPLPAEDSSEDLTRSGIVKLAPALATDRESRFGIAAHWVRAVEEETDAKQRAASPRRVKLFALHPHAVWADQLRTVRDEVFGSSDGEPNQELVLRFQPVQGTPRVFVREIAGEDELERIGSEHVLRRIGDDGRTATWIEWRLVEDLSASAPDARDYELDRAQGHVRFGDGFHGRIPPADARNLLAYEYRVGGGAAGNVAAGEVKTMTTAVPGIAEVANPLPAGGGVDTASAELSARLATERLAHGRRAVTAEDFERLALAGDSRLVRARCLIDRAAPRVGRERWIRVAVLVSGTERLPVPTLALREALAERLRAACHGELVPDVRLDVVPPRFVQIEVHAILVVESVAAAAGVEVEAQRALREFLHPVRGGRERNGWEFGRRPHESDVLARIARIAGVRDVQELGLRRTVGAQTLPLPATFTPREIVASAESHALEVRYRAGEET